MKVKENSCLIFFGKTAQHQSITEPNGLALHGSLTWWQWNANLFPHVKEMTKSKLPEPDRSVKVIDRNLGNKVSEIETLYKNAEFVKYEVYRKSEALCSSGLIPILHWSDSVRFDNFSKVVKSYTGADCIKSMGNRYYRDRAV